MAAEISSGSDDHAPFSGINITPFVDVVLVLLVIFMVTAPVLSKEILEVNLPKSSTGEQKMISSLGVAITREGQILLNGQLIDPQSFSIEIKRIVTTQPDTQAIISADGEAKHADLVRVIDLIKSAGLSKFALQVQHTDS
jgi:biopolymer transport protein ExbD